MQDFRAQLSSLCLISRDSADLSQLVSQSEIRLKDIIWREIHVDSGVDSHCLAFTDLLARAED